MKQRKRRRTMRPPIPSSSTLTTATPSTTPPQLCVHGACTLYPHLVSPPRRFSDSDKGEHLSISDDGLTVVYDGPAQADKDASLIRTDQPVPTSGIAAYYFEVCVREKGDRGHIGVGLCTRKADVKKMPGWEDGSYGYHGDDGKLFNINGSAGKPYGPEYGTNDIVGCCWDLVNNVVFFTLNGRHLGKAFENLSGTYYPTIGLQSNGARIVANFGGGLHHPSPHQSHHHHQQQQQQQQQQQLSSSSSSSSNSSTGSGSWSVAPALPHRYKFDIENYINQQRERVLNEIFKECKLANEYKLLSDTILSYLMHNGYAKTAGAFARDSGRERVHAAERELMNKRQRICGKVLRGEIDEAIAEVETEFPRVLDAHLNVSFLLHTQKFIEMIVSGCSPEETVEYGLRKLSVFRNADFIKQMEDLDDQPTTTSASASSSSPSSCTSPSSAATTPHAIDDAAATPSNKRKKSQYADTLKDVYLLLAYGDPANSPTGYLTKQSRREMVADRLNSAILATQGRPMKSVVERFICQSRNVLTNLLKMGNGPFALVSEHDIL